MAILRFKDSSNAWSVAGDGVGGGSIDRTVILSAANWSSSAPYTQTVAMSEILGTDAPIVSLDLSSVSNDNIAEYQKEYNYINRINTVDGKIIVYCYNNKPTKDLTLSLKIIYNTKMRGSADTNTEGAVLYSSLQNLSASEQTIARKNINAAETVLYTGKFLASSWSENAPYTQTLTITGILASDAPVADINLTNATVDNYEELTSNYSLIGRMKTSENAITAYCYTDKPTIDLDIRFKVVR